MKSLTILLTILFISLLSSPSWSETVSWDDLVERDELYYKKFTNTPFNGETVEIDPRRGYGKTIIEWMDGKKHGEVTSYYGDGQLYLLVNYIHGQRHGITIFYGIGDKILKTQMWKNDKQDGVTEYFNLDGSLSGQETFKNEWK